MLNLESWEALFSDKIREVATQTDPAHDYLHFKRVVVTAKYIAHAEKANMAIIVPAAWLHDLVIIPKNDPLRAKASLHSADQAIKFLEEIKYESKYFKEIHHAIHAHSFSANIQTETLEAQIIQDADRLDALGAIGIARCFATGGVLNRSFYSAQDPLCENREPDDAKFTLDHFYKKLFKISETLNTSEAQKIAKERTQLMISFVNNLEQEL